MFTVPQIACAYRSFFFFIVLLGAADPELQGLATKVLFNLCASNVCTAAMMKAQIRTRNFGGFRFARTCFDLVLIS